MSGKCPECEVHFEDKLRCPHCRELLIPDYELMALKPELGWCKCGQEATIAIEFGDRRVALCDPCWKRGTGKLLADLKKRRSNRHV